jgi:acyl-homoserine-lactone acylase
VVFAARASQRKPRAMSGEQLLAGVSRSLSAVDESLRDAGSNGWAFGRETTANGRGMLLTNPHWPWGGMSKFYQVHLTVPGEYDVMGVAYPGSPVVLIGFNESIGWTHTVSTGPRFVLREMKLGSTPTSYVIDGQQKEMTARNITVEVKDGPSKTRTYYTTEFGPLVQNATIGLAWSATRAFAFTDINLDNNRLIEQWLALGRANSAEEARMALGTILAAPLINTLITDKHGDAVYTDYSLKPYLEDAKLVACALPGVGQALTAAGRPTMDGSRSACNPDSDPNARQAGVLPMSKLPFLRRGDYVVNANNSYWLTNPAEPITGLPLINGAAAADIGLRARMNFTLVADRLAGRDGLRGDKLTPQAIRAMLIGSKRVPLAGNRSLAAELLMPAVVTLCDASTTAPMADGTTQDIAAACTVLRAWDRRYNAESVGTHVFREFFSGANAIGASLWSVPFSAVDPVNTPREPNLANPAVNTRLRQALGQSVRNLAARGIALDRPWGELFYTAARGANLPTGGGSTAEGVANQMNGAPLSATGYNNVTSGSSYVAAMAFGKHGPEVDAVLIPGQSVNPASPYHYDQLQDLWSQRRWQRLPFRADEIARDPNLTVTRIRQ